MSFYWYLSAVLLVFAFTLTLVKGGQLVERITGRESRPEKSTLVVYDAIYFGLAIGIGIPPVYLLPDTDPLVITAFILLGIIVGSFAAQAIFGRKHA